jgi:hypothetical protein
MPSRLEESRGGVAGAHSGGGVQGDRPRQRIREAPETDPATFHHSPEPIHHLSFHKAEGSALNHHGSTRRKTRGAGAQHRRHCAAPPGHAQRHALIPIHTPDRCLSFPTLGIFLLRYASPVGAEVRVKKNDQRGRNTSDEDDVLRHTHAQ